MNVTAILVAALVVGGVGILIGFFLGISGEKFKVEVDEKEVAILGELPGNNCGGCGYAGCSGLAAAIAKGEAPVNQCPVGGAPVAAKIGAIMGEFLAYALAYYGLAGESAVQVSGVNPSSFSVAFMDSLYTLNDSVLLSENRIRPVVVPDQLEVYFISGTQDVELNENRLLSVVEDACRGGVTCFQFREKGVGTLVGQQKLELAQQLKQICAKYNVLYIINDDVDLAVAVNADGVHVGQEDMRLEEVRNLVGHKVVGISIHSVEELHKTDVIYADCVGVGPMYATSSKPDAQVPCGPNRITELQSEGLTLPCVGIGGITLDNAKPVLQAGASGVAVISAIAHADSPYEAAQEFKHLVDGIK